GFQPRSVVAESLLPSQNYTICPVIDSAVSDSVRSALKEMFQAAKCYESACATLLPQLNVIIDHLQILEQPSASPIAPKGSEAAAEFPVSPVSLHFFHLSCPERIFGDSGDCHPFISQCKLHFDFNASAFSSDRAKIAFRISYVTAVCYSLPEFLKTFTQIFQSTTPGREAAKALVFLRQGKRSVIDNAVESWLTAVGINRR
uniref:Uncharacterized protein n=1 Tax=Mola mola TaxID=94237 RepID=A0A3Q3W030_MOLML